MKILGYLIGAIIVGIIIVVIVANTKDPTESDAISFAKNQISKLMKDPSSTEFKSVDFFPSSQNQKGEIYGFVCGFVNAKNSFGAYTGFTRFSMNIIVNNNGRSATMSQPLIEDLTNPSLTKGFDDFWKENCRKK